MIPVHTNFYRNECIDSNDSSKKLDYYNDARTTDLELRKLYVSSPNDYRVMEPYVNLVDIYDDNEDLFTVLPLSEEEKNESVILTKRAEVLKAGTSAIPTLNEFQDNFDIFTEGLLECMNWDNLFLAGGSILAALTKLPDNIKTDDEKRKYYHDEKYDKSDLDLYIYGLSERNATKKMYEIYENIKKVLPCPSTCIRSSRVITIVSQYPYRHIQIVLRLFKSPAEILHSFDVDSCSVGYNGSNVFCTHRALYAIKNKRNIVDMTRRSLAYEFRLVKYNERGYAIVVPNLDKDRINYRIYSKTPTQVRGLARILLLEYVDNSIKYNIYRDTLNMHQVTMYKNIAANSSYEKSDYSLVFLPWGKKWNATTISEHMKKKNDMLNKSTTTNDNEFNDYLDDDENAIVTINSLPKHVCFVGNIYQVVKDNGIKTPEFEDEADAFSYNHKFVSGRVIWAKEFNSNMLGSFNMISDDTAQWYNDAYNEMEIDQLCELVNKNDIENVNTFIQKLLEDQESNDCIRIINSRDISCRNPLHLAIEHNNLEMVKLLITNGADPMKCTKLYKTAIHKTCEEGNLDILKYIVESSTDNIEFNAMSLDSYRLSPILYTIMYGHLDCFKYLFENIIKRHTDIVWVFKYDKSRSYRALEMCMLYKRYEFANYLFDNGYDEHDYYSQDMNSVKNKDERRHIMHQSILHWDFTFVKLLLDRFGYDTYKDHITCEGALVNQIKRSKHDSQAKYLTDMLFYICKLNDTFEHIYNVLSHYVSMLDIDHIKYIVNSNKFDPTFTSITTKTTILDLVNKQIDLQYELLTKNQMVNKFREYESTLGTKIASELWINAFGKIPT